MKRTVIEHCSEQMKMSRVRHSVRKIMFTVVFHLIFWKESLTSNTVTPLFTRQTVQTRRTLAVCPTENGTHQARCEVQSQRILDSIVPPVSECQNGKHCKLILRVGSFAFKCISICHCPLSLWLLSLPSDLLFLNFGSHFWIGWPFFQHWVVSICFLWCDSSHWDVQNGWHQCATLTISNVPWSPTNLSSFEGPRMT